MSESTQSKIPGGVKMGFRLRMLGTPAPVFPGFEIDISTRVADEQKPDAVWHRERARQILETHPEVKALIGHTPSTAVWCVLFACAQIGLAILAGSQSIWLVIALAYIVGAWINMNLFMLAHECNHQLVFGNAKWDRWLFTFTTLPMFLSGHHTWWIEHPVHHNDLGAKKDFIKRRRTFFLMTRFWSPLVFPYSLFMLVMQFIRSTVGLTIYLGCLLTGKVKPTPLVVSILADDHLVSGYERNRLSAWAVLFPFFSVSLTAVLFYFVGWQAVVYLLLSQTFMTGFMHPLMFGMILSNSHFHGHKHYQPSSSHYSWFNWLTFHFGYHTEHHDLAGVPWSRLPAVRALAPEFYDCLAETKSYTALTWKFLFSSGEDFAQCFDSEEHRNVQMVQAIQAGATGPASEPGAPVA